MDARNKKAESPASGASKIELLEIRPATSAGNVQAFVTVRLGGVTINGCKIVQQQGQAAWLAMFDEDEAA